MVEDRLLPVTVVAPFCMCSVLQGLVATGSNSVWYLNLVEKVSVRLHGAHTGPPSVVASSSSISPPWVRGEGGQQQRQVLLASAAADLSVRVWSVSLCVSPSQVADDVARPQHVALFAVPYRWGVSLC
mmetsp:Transcript_45684/g.89979  ORF Transcript_45684/g.89979 Transcript_45684/m.89979 type:complete len:128 (-) Transcript_45684:38-421(-)